MKASDLQMNGIYICSTSQGDIHVEYYGMTEDKYVFYPLQPKEKTL